MGELSDESRIAADLNGDGNINSMDMTLLKRILLKSVEYCPADTNRDGYANEKSSIKYRGYFYDGETGLYYLNSRFYDPETARFIQEDTYRGNVEDPLSLNLYVYTANNPITYYDPTGHYYVNGMHVSGYWEKQEQERQRQEQRRNNGGRQGMPNDLWMRLQAEIKQKKHINWWKEKLSDGRALVSGFVITTIKQVAYEPYFVEGTAIINTAIGAPYTAEFRQNMQERGDRLENKAKDLLGIQNNKYYHLGGTIGSAGGMAIGILEAIAGVPILGGGATGTAASVAGSIPSGGATLSLAPAGASELTAGAALTAGGVLTITGSYNGFRQNYGRFNEMRKEGNSPEGGENRVVDGDIPEGTGGTEIKYPGNDPTKSPGSDWEWRGKGDPGSGKGSWYNPKTKESLHPDLNHPDPIGPHWDYTAPDGTKFRLNPDGSLVPK